MVWLIQKCQWTNPISGPSKTEDVDYNQRNTPSIPSGLLCVELISVKLLMEMQEVTRTTLTNQNYTNSWQKLLFLTQSCDFVSPCSTCKSQTCLKQSKGKTQKIKGITGNGNRKKTFEFLYITKNSSVWFVLMPKSKYSHLTLTIALVICW